MKYSVIILKQHSKLRGWNKKTGKPYPSRWALDMSSFREALELSYTYYQEWCEGEPRFDEWRLLQPNPGKARERAAAKIAEKYRKSARQAKQEEEEQKSKPDEFSVLVGGEKTMARAAAKIADAWDSLSKTTVEKRKHTDLILADIRNILLQYAKHERHRLLKKLQALTKNKPADTSIKREGTIKKGKRSSAARSLTKDVNTNDYAHKSDPLVDAIIKDESE